LSRFPSKAIELLNFKRLKTEDEQIFRPSSEEFPQTSVMIGAVKLRYMIGPIVVFAAVVMLLVVARYYERLPVEVPNCRMKEMTGIPCLACRGTRSFQAIAKGHLIEAIKLNPGAVLGAGLSVLWLASYLIRRGNPPSKAMSTKAIIWIVCLILAGNWIFLIVTRHWYP